MASKRFLEVHELTAEFEGGWSNHPKDPGGKTMYGITERVYHAWLKERGHRLKPVRQITMAEAKEIYYTNYWLRAGCHKLNHGVDRMTYDAAVNSGVRRARQWLKQSIGSDDDRVTVRNMHEVRMRFLRGLKTWPTFGRGWTRRVDAMRDVALLEAVTPKPKEVLLPPEPAVKQKPKDQKPNFIAGLIQILLNLFKRKA